MSSAGKTFEYVRRYYGVPAQRGMRVTCDGKPGTITCGDGAHILVRPDGDYPASRRWICHPTWRMTYHTPSGDVVYGD